MLWIPFDDKSNAITQNEIGFDVVWNELTICIYVNIAPYADSQTSINIHGFFLCLL